MKERLTNNPGLKLLAILLAFLVWLIVSNASNPLKPDTKEVKVEILNEQVLADSNLTYEVLGKSTVTVSYDVHTLDAYKISSADFRAYADLSELYDVTGSIPINIEVVNNKALIANPSAKPGVIQIKTEAIQTKGFDLQVHIKGEPEEGYALGAITLSPAHVEVTGAVSDIGKINSVGVEIDVDGINGEFSGILEPRFYDANGNGFAMGKEISLNVAEIACRVQVLKVKNLSLDFQVSGNVASGYRFTGVESDLKTISVEGMKSVLASLNTLTIPGELLKLDGATKDVAIQVDLSTLLPEEVTIAGDGSVVANVVLKVENLETRGFKLAAEDIKLLGAAGNKQYTFSVKTLQLEIRGLSEDLDALKMEMLEPVVDVSDMEDGDYPGTLSVDLGDGFELISTEAFQILAEPKAGEPVESANHTTQDATEEITKETTAESVS